MKYVSLMITKGIVLVLIVGLTLGGGATYLAYEHFSSVNVEFPLSLNDPAEDLLLVTTQTWSGRGQPNGTVAEDGEFSQYYDHVDILNLKLDQWQNNFNISMQWADDIVYSEGVVYGFYIETSDISYIVTYTESGLICVSDSPERNIDWHDYYYIESSTEMFHGSICFYI